MWVIPTSRSVGIERMGKGQDQGVDVVEGDARAVFVNEVFLAFEDDFIPDVVGVPDRQHLALEFWVRRQGPGFKPSSAGSVHCCAVVGVFLAGAAPDGVVDHVFATELNLVAM